VTATALSRRNFLRAGVALGGGVLLAACGSSDGDGDGGGAAADAKALTGKALEDAARAEGAQLLWYNTGNPTLVEKVTAGFKTAYPWITLQGVPVPFTDLPAKVTTEAITNAPTADVMWFPPTLRQNMLKDDVLTDVVIDGDKNMAADTLDEGNIAHPVWQLAIGLVYNPNVVPEPPSDPLELADPKWKSKIAFDRVANLGQSTTWLSVWKGRMGEAAWNKWLDDLKAQDIFVTPNGGAAYEAVLKGERQLGISSSNNVLSQDPGTPMAMNFKIPPVPFYNHQYLTRRARHPATAKVFMEWASTADGQGAIAEAGLSPIMKIDNKNSLDKVLPAGVTLVPGTELADFSTNTDTYAKALSQRWPG
jgi:ABC-type Fe3+ transport system substrate-binding protein